MGVLIGDEKIGFDLGEKESSHRETTTFTQLLGFRARVIGPSTIMQELAAVYPAPPAWSVDAFETADATYRLQPDSPRPGSYSVALDGVPLGEAGQLDEFLPLVESVINGAASEQVGAKYLCFHAGAVACGGDAILMPAAAGAGKTTLTAALVASGFQYLSDEVGVLDPATGQLVPFARGMCVKEGARPVLEPLYPRLVDATPRLRPSGEAVYYLPPPEDAWPAGPVPVRFVILPRFVPGST